METPFLDAERSEWQTPSRLDFFNKIKSLFKTLEQNEKFEIMFRLGDDDTDYFEIPVYDKAQDGEPVIAVIFEGESVFIDFIDPEKKEKYLAKINALVGATAKPIKWRPLNRNDWLKRLEVIDSLEAT